jgi:Domain of unknown function (DUF4390)
MGLAVGAGGRAAAQSLRIVPIARNESVLISVELADAYTDEVRATIASGLQTTFTYDVDLRMVVPAWVDRTIATAVVSTSDRYDNLTRRHSLSRMIDGRVDGALVTEDESVARRWLMSLNSLPLCSTSKLDPLRDYYVRISARVRPPGGSLLGWARAITSRATFTFIP